MKIFCICRFTPDPRVKRIGPNIFPEATLEKIFRFLIKLSQRYGIKTYTRFYRMLPGHETSRSDLESSLNSYDFVISRPDEMMREFIGITIASDRIVYYSLYVHLSKPLSDMKIDQDSFTISSVEDPNFIETVHEIDTLKRLWEKETGLEIITATITEN